MLIQPKPGTDNVVVELLPEDCGFIFVTVMTPQQDPEDPDSRVAIVAIDDMRRALGMISGRSIGDALAGEVVACLDALRKTSTDPVACALAQRLVAELSTCRQAEAEPEPEAPPRRPSRELSLSKIGGAWSSMKANGLGSVIKIGSLSTSHVLVQGAARMHAIIESDRGEFVVSDLGTRDGTWLNGVEVPKVGRMPIKPGDVLRIADEEFVIVE